jgi:hypothetical protein
MVMIATTSISLVFEHLVSQYSIPVECKIIQNNICLTHVNINLNKQNTEIFLPIDFDLTVDTIALIIETQASYISNTPLMIKRLTFDDLFSIPFIPHTGQFIDDTNKLHDLGNTLYAPGKLIYNFKIPLLRNCNL